MPAGAVAEVAKLYLNGERLAPGVSTLAKLLKCSAHSCGALDTVLKDLRKYEARAWAAHVATLKLDAVVEVDATSVRHFWGSDGQSHHFQLWGGIQRSNGAFVVYGLPEAVTQPGAVGPVESFERIQATGALETNFVPRTTSCRCYCCCCVSHV